jgi:hypothetical protein
MRKHKLPMLCWLRQKFVTREAGSEG